VKLLALLGHIMRRHGLKNLVVTGRTEGKRVRGTTAPEMEVFG